MAAISDTLRDEIFSKFTDVFPQFKTFSAYYKRLLVIWYFRLFVKCSTVSMILLLGICYYRNGVFDYSKDAGLYLVVLIICVFNSARQLMRDRQLETYFLDVSDAFEGMTKILLKWCGANNPSFAKMLKLLLEEMNGDRSTELNTKDLLYLLIFDGIIWFANTTCLLVNMFNQFYFTVLIFFITTLVTIAMENLLVNMRNKPYKFNENMTAEIDKICSIVNNYKEVSNDNSYGKTKPETTDVTKENSGFTVDYFDLQKCCEEKGNLNKSLNFPPDSEQKNSANNNCANNLDISNAGNICIGNEVDNVPQECEPFKNGDDLNPTDVLFQKQEEKCGHDPGVPNDENICRENEVYNASQQFESLENSVHDLNPRSIFLKGQKQKQKVNLDTNFASTDNKNTASVEEESAKNNCVNNLDTPKAENIFAGNEIDNVLEECEHFKNGEDLNPLDALSQKQEEKSEHFSIAPNADNICTGNEVDNVLKECEPFKNGDDLNPADVLFQKQEEKCGHDPGVPNEENISMENDVANASQQFEPLENSVHDLNPGSTLLQGQKQKVNLDNNFASTDNKNTASVEEESANNNSVSNSDAPKAENIFAGNEVDKIPQQLDPLKKGDDLNPADGHFQKQEDNSENNSGALNPEDICTGNEVDNFPQQLEHLKNSDDHNQSHALNQKEGKKSEHDSGAENSCIGIKVDYVSQQFEIFENGVDLNPAVTFLQEQEKKVDLNSKFDLHQNNNIAFVEYENANNIFEHNFGALNSKNIYTGNEVHNVPQQFEPLKNGYDLNPSDAVIQKQKEKIKHDFIAPNVENICTGNEVDNVPQQLEPLKNCEDLNPPDALFQKREEKSEHYSIATNAQSICTENEVDNVPQECEHLKNGDDLILADVLSAKQEEKSGHISGVNNEENTCMGNEVVNITQQLEPLENSVHDINPENTDLQRQKRKVNLDINFVSTDNQNTALVEEESANNNCVDNFDIPKPENIFTGSEVHKIIEQLCPLKNGDDRKPVDAIFQRHEEKGEYDSGASNAENICTVNEIYNVPQKLEPLKNEYVDLNPAVIFLQEKAGKAHLDCKFFLSQDKNNDPVEEESVISNYERKFDTPNKENTCTGNEVDNIPQELKHSKNGDGQKPSDAIFQKQEEKSEHDSGASNLENIRTGNEVDNVPKQLEPLKNSDDHSSPDALFQKQQENRENDSGTSNAENICSGNEIDNVPQEREPLKNGDDLSSSAALIQKQTEKRKYDSGAPKVEGICIVNEVGNVPQQLEPLKNGEDLNPLDALSQKQEEKSEHFSIAPIAENICTGNEVDNVLQECEPFKNGDDLNPADVLFQKQEEKCGHDPGVPNEENICMENEVDNASQQFEPLENSVHDLNPGSTFLQGQKQEVNLDTNFASTDNKNTASVEEESANNNSVSNSDAPKAENIFAGNELDKIPQQLEPLKNGEDLNPLDALSQKQEEKNKHFSIAPIAENICTGNEVDNVLQECEPFKNGDDLNPADVLFQKQEEKCGHDPGVPSEENICMENEVDNASQQFEPLENSVHDLNPGSTLLQGQKQKVNLDNNFASTDNKNTAFVGEESVNNNSVSNSDAPKAENIFVGNEVDKIPQQLGPLKNDYDLNPANGHFQKQEENSENDSGTLSPEDICIGNEVDIFLQPFEFLKNDDYLDPSDTQFQKQEEKREHDSGAPSGENICIANEGVNDTKRSKSLENYKNEENIKYDTLSKNKIAEEDILVNNKTFKRSKNIQNSESDNNNSSADCVEKIVLSSEIKNPDSYSDILGISSGLSNFSSNQKQKFNITEESIFDPFVKPLDCHITVIPKKNINNSFELSGSKENYEIFSNKEQENSTRTENILNNDKKYEPCITAHRLETPFVSNIYKAYEQHSESVMAETREGKSVENRNTERDFFNEKELKCEARDSILEDSLGDNDTLNCLLTPETHVISPSMTLEDEAVELLGTENSEKAEDVISHTELSRENASMLELSMGTEIIPNKNTEFEDIKNITERKFSVNVSHQDEADTTVSDNCGKLPSKITEFKNPEKESRHHLTPNEATSIKAKCNVSETDTKIPNVSEKNHNDTSGGCISRKSAGSTTEGKYIASTLPYSDTTDESGDDFHFVLKKHRPLDINLRKDAEQRKTKVCDENQFQMTNTMLRNTEQLSERKIALNYGKFAFCMDLYPESEIELVFKSSGKSMKRSTVYPFKGHK